MALQHLLRRIGETEYGALIDPRHARETEFGTFYHRPDFPDRRDANQLCRVRCSPDRVDELLAAVEELYRGTRLPYRKMSGYDPSTWQHLGSPLQEAGWELARGLMMVHEAASLRPRSPQLAIRVVDPKSKDLESLYTLDGGIDRGFLLARNAFSRVGGEYLVGYAEGKPVCCTGWFVVDRIARFRHVFTAPSARDRGYASTLIQHVQAHRQVARREALAIFVDSEGPAELYEELGFRTVGLFWEAIRFRSQPE